MKIIKSILAVALCAVGFAALAIAPSPYRDLWSSTPDPRPIKDSTSIIDWGMASKAFESFDARHGKFLEASADAMIAAYTARIETDPTDCEALICRAFAYLKKAGENEAFDRLAQEFGFTFDNDTMHFTGELVHAKGVTPEMNEVTAEICDILLPLMKAAYADLGAVPKNWKGSVAITPDVYPVDESVYFDYADVLMSKAALAEMMCILDMVKGFDVAMDSDKLADTFNAINQSNGKRGVQAILENNPDFFSKVRDQNALTEAGDWWSAAAIHMDQWDKAHAKRSDDKMHFFDWNFERLDSNGEYGVEWLRRHRDGLANLPYWASPFDYTKINGSTEQFWTLKPLFAGKFLRAHFPEFAPGRDKWAPWCNEPLLDTLPDSTFCGMWPGVSPTYLGDYLTTRWTVIPPYTANRAAPVDGIWYKNFFEMGFDNTGNPLWFARDNASPIKLLDPEFNVRGVTAVFKGWSGVGYDVNSPISWEGSEIPTPLGEPMKYINRRVELTANFDIPKVTYLDFDETAGKLVERTVECELVKADTTEFTTGKVYAVVRDVTIANRITVWSTPENPAKLVLCDGATLWATNGVEVDVFGTATNALVICGQALGTGTLEATGGYNQSGIGGGGSTTGKKGVVCGIVTINGGTVIAKGGYNSAGIGGGALLFQKGVGGTVTINGGTVIATGGDYGAGIGGGNTADGGTVTINGGTVTATGGGTFFGAGIGAGDKGTSHGTVKFGAGIASGVEAGELKKKYGEYVKPFYMTTAEYEADHHLQYVMLPCYSLKIPEATEGYSYAVSYEGAQPNAVLADQTNTYAIAAGATVRVRFTPGSGYMWVDESFDNPMIIANLSEDTVIDAGDLPTTMYAPAGYWNNPWKIGTPNAADVVAYTNWVDGKLTLVVEGKGAIKDMDNPPPWDDFGGSIQSVEVGWGVTMLGRNAFAKLTNLSEATLPEGLLVIGAQAFYGCSDALAEVTIPSTVTNIGATAFYNCRQIQSLTVPASVRTVGENAFAICTTLTSVEMESPVPPVAGTAPFSGHNPDLKIYVPNGSGAAYKAASVWSDYADSIVELGSPECPWEVGSPNAADVIAYTDITGKLVIEGEGDMKDFNPKGDPAPWGRAITEVEIREGVTSIGAKAFAKCESLSDVVVKAMTPPALGADAFAGTADDLKISVPGGSGATYNAAPGWRDYVDRIVDGLPGAPTNPWEVGTPNADDVTAYTNGVGGLVVKGWGDMRDFDPPSDPTPWGTDITEVKIGEDVTSIGTNAFADCTSLTNVTVEAMTPPALGDGELSGCTAIETIYVPYGTSEAYKAAPGWSDFADCFVELPAPIQAESDEFTVDLRTRVEFDEGKTRIDVVTWSATAWGAVPGSWYTDLGFTNLTTGATGVIAEGLVGENLDDCPLPEKDGEYLLTHSTGDLKAFVTFVVSGYPIGTPTNPWLVGPDGSRDSTVAWKDNDAAIVYLKPPRSAVSRTGLETLTNAMGGVNFAVGLVTADGTATNEVKMIIGASGKQYTKLEDMLESDDDSWTFFDVTGCVVSYDGMGHSGTMASDTFLPGIPTNLTANAYTAFGYEFQGWTTNGDTKVVFEDEAAIDDPQPGDIYDLKAVWKLTPVTVGKGVTARLDENGTLHIEGKGKMKDFSETDPAPWAEFAPDIKAIEVAEGVTKIGNAAFDSLDYAETTTALTFQDEDHVLNLFAFVSADGSKTNAPLAKAFSAYKDSSGTVEPIVAFQTLDQVYVYTKAPTLMRYGYDEVRLLTLPDLKAVQTAELIETAGETPYSKTMQGLLDEALDKIDKATNYDEVMDGYVERYYQIKAQAEKDKTNEIEGTKITWRVMDGTLVISGEGAMPDFVEPDYPDGAPWNEMQADITNVTVAAGITSVGDAAFAVCPANGEASVLFKDPALELNLGAFVSGDGSATNVPTVKVEIVTDDGRTLRVVPGGWTDADNSFVTYDSLAEAIEDGATTVVAAFEKKTDEGEKAVPPVEVEEIVKTVTDESGNEIELTAKYTNAPAADGSISGLVTEIENLPIIVEITGSNIVVEVTATNKEDVAVQVVQEMDGAMSAACEAEKIARGCESVSTIGFRSFYLDMSAFWSFKNDGGRLVEFTKSIIAHIPMKLYDGQIYSVSRRHADVTEVLPLWYEGIDDSDTAEWVKVDVANQELVVKTRKFCDYALGELQLEKSCQVTVADGDKLVGAADPVSLPTNFQIRVTGELNASDFAGYAKRALGEAVGDYAINFVCARMAQDYVGPFEVLPGKFTIVERPEPLSALGKVSYANVKNSVFLPGKKATWKAKSVSGCVFAGWVMTDISSEIVSNQYAKLSWNELRDSKLVFPVKKGEKVTPNEIEATWAHIDEDLIGAVVLTPSNLVVETLSHVTASVKGLPSGLKFSAKTLAITGKPKLDGTFKVTVTVKNASGYSWKGAFTMTVAGKVVTDIVPPAEEKITRKGVPVMLWCDSTMGTVKGTGVYALPKKLTIQAKAKKGYAFAGWYYDPGFANSVTNFAGKKDYLTESPTIVLKGETYLFARFVEKTTKADPIAWLRYAGAGYCGADASVYATNETWYVGVKLPTNACQVAFGSLTRPTVKVSGLPSGVKFDNKTLRFTGVPTKSGKYTVKVSVKNVCGSTDVLKVPVTVVSLPKWAVGNFSGYHIDEGVTNGTFAATVGKTGKVSGKTAGGIAATTFSAKNFIDVFTLDGSNLIYKVKVSVSYKLGKKTFKESDTLYLMEDLETGLGVIGGGDEDGCGSVGVQHAWDRKDIAFPAFAKSAPPTITLDNGLRFSFGANGKVTIAGKVLGDNGKLVTVSGSTYVLPTAWVNEECLRAQVYVYVAPKKNLADGVSEAYDVYLTIDDASGKFVVASLDEPSMLPDWVHGSFDGSFIGVELEVAPGVTNRYTGSTAFTISNLGKITGTAKTDLGDITFSAPSFDFVDGDGTYWANLECSLTYKRKTVKVPFAVNVKISGTTGLGVIGYNGDRDSAVQNPWKSRDDLDYPSFPTGSAALSLVDGELVLGFGANGAVTISGKVTGDNGEPVSVSGSSQAQPAVWSGNTLTAYVDAFVAPKKNLANGFFKEYKIFLTTDGSGKFVSVSM